MKLYDIVTQLQAVLPTLTDQLTDTIAVDTMIHNTGAALITTSADHGLSVGDSIHVLGAITPISISGITHTAGAVTAEVTTATDHDLTLYSTYTEGNVAVISGSDQPEFNGTFTIVGVTDRRHLTITVDSAAPDTVTGTMTLDNGSNVFNTVRGQYAVVSVPTSTTLIISHGDASLSLGTLDGTITLRANPRITAGISDEAVVASYSRKIESGVKTAEMWLYVVLDDATVSRGRTSRIDAVDVQGVTTEWQQYVLQPFSLLLAVPAANQSLGRNARDTAEDLLRPILRTVCGNRFPTGLYASLCGPAQFVSHAFARYDGSVYWHDFQFEQRAEMTIHDTVGAGETVAFRDVELTITPHLDATQGAGNMTDDIDLDDVPL